MAVYIGYLLLAGIQIPFFCKRDRLGRQYFNAKRYLNFCCLELVLLAGIRGYTVGADTEKYVSAIDYYGGMPFKQLLTAELVYPYDFEIGYFALTKLGALLGIGKTGFLFVVALLIYIPTFHAIKKYSPMPYVSILCYFAFGYFSYSLGIFKQMIASAVLFYGLKYIEENRFFKYLLIVALAMTFHTTAAVGIFLYFLYKVNWKQIVIWMIPLELGFLLLGRTIVLVLVQIFPKYARYLGGVYDVQGGTYLMLFLLNVVLLACILVRRDQQKEIEDITICALILAILLHCVGYSMGLIGRAAAYFSTYLFLAVPYVLYNLRTKIGAGWSSVVSLFVILCLFAFTFMEFHGNHYVVPYYTFFA